MGLASIFKMGDPLARKLTGININQDDYPWWAISILGWLACANALQNASGKLQFYSSHMKNISDGTDHPKLIYKYYKDYIARFESEVIKSNAGR